MSNPFVLSSWRAGGYPTGLVQSIYREILEDKLRSHDTSNKFSGLKDVTDLGISSSVGGITLGAMACGLSAADTTDLFIDAGPKLFPNRWHQNISQLFNYKYDMDTMEGILDNAFGDTTLEDCLPMKLAIGVMDLDTMEPTFITNYAVNKNFGKHRPGTKLADIVRVGVAVPPFYPPQAIELVDKNGKTEILDGLDLAVISNDPIAYGVMSAKEFAHPEDIKVYGASAAIAPPSGDDEYDYTANQTDGKLHSQHSFSGLLSLLNVIALNRQGLDKKAIKGALHQLDINENDPRINLFHINSKNYTPEEREKIHQATNGKVTPLDTKDWGLFNHDSEMHQYMIYRIGEKMLQQRSQIDMFVREIVDARLNPGGDYVAANFGNSAIEATIPDGDGSYEIVGSYDPTKSTPPSVSVTPPSTPQ